MVTLMKRSLPMLRHLLPRRLSLLLVCAGAVLTGAGVQAADVAEVAAGLKAGSFKKKAGVVAELAGLGDPKVVPLLEALRKGRLYYRKADGRLVVTEKAGKGYRLTDPLSGEVLGGAKRGAVRKIRVNNRMRGAIKAALSQLELFSPYPARRLAAARSALNHGSAQMIRLIEMALAAETDGAVRDAMQFSLLGAQLKAGSTPQRLAAIEALSGSTTPRVRSLLGALANDPKQDGAVRESAAAAIKRIEDKLFFLGIGLNVFQGISLGSVLLLAAVGLAITFGVMGVINMAHGEMIMLGAYSTFVVQELFRAFLPASLFDWYLVVAIPTAFMVAGLVGVVLEKGVIRWLYGRPLETLLATWGISLILQQLVRSIFGAPNKEVANPSWMSGGLEVAGGFVLTYNRLYLIVFCFLVLGAITLLLRRTGFGLSVRAVTQNRGMAATMGIPTSRVDSLTFGLGSGLAGMAGVALSQIGNVSPNLGQLYIVDSFMVVVFGGVGNLAGTLVGAMTLGVVNKFLEPVAGAVLGKVVVMVAIILFIQRRPQGLFALRGRAAEA